MSTAKEFVISKKGILKKYGGNGGDVIIPDEVTKIDMGVFKRCSNLNTITIPDGVTEIGWGAFRDCSNLSKIVLPKHLTEIGDGAFSGCSSLTEIIIPDSVTKIGWNTFISCTALKSVTIGTGVTYIGECAFAGCTSLAELTILSKVNGIGKRVFYECTSLDVICAPACEISVFEASDKLKVAAGYAVLKSQGYQFDPNIEKKAKTCIKSRKQALYPSAIKIIPLLQHMVDNKIIPKEDIANVIELAEKNNSTEAKLILLDYKSREFGDFDSFDDEFELTDSSSMRQLKMDWPMRENRWGGGGTDDAVKGIFIAKYAGKEAVLDCPREIDIFKIDGVSFRSGKKPEAYESITEVHFPDCYRFFGKLCFEGCISLKEVYLPLSLEGIRDKAFMNCTSLETVVFGGEPELYLIGEQIFKNCTSLKDIYFLSSNVSIGRAMFSGCSGYTVHCPVGSKIEQELRGRRCVPLTEDDVERFAKKYFAEPICRKIYFNRSNVRSKDSIKEGEPLDVVMNGEELAIRRENGVLYKLPIYPMFEKYITGKIAVKPYKELYYYGKSAYCFEVELTLKDGIK